MPQSAATNTIRWTWLGPVLISLIIAMSAAWALQLDRRVTRMEEVVTELVKSRGEFVGKLETVIEQNRTQDIRTTQISTRLDTLIQMHVSEATNKRAK